MEKKGVLEVVSCPAKTRYRAGQVVQLDGIKLKFNGEDVTPQTSFDLENNHVWRASDKTLDVHAKYQDASGYTHVATIQLKRKKSLAIIMLGILAGLGIIAAAAALALYLTTPKLGDDTGSYIIPAEGMSEEEAQAMLDEITEKSRIQVSLAPKMHLADDGRLRVNFAVMEDNNGFSERMEITQDDVVVYRSGIVDPGNLLQWTGSTTEAHVGPAVATVYAIDGETRQDSGNPVSVEVEIVDGSEEDENVE